MNRDELDMIRHMLTDGNTTAAVASMLELITDLMDEVDTLSVQLETLLDSLGGDNDEDEEFDDTTYIITCQKCGCVMEVEAWLLEDETAELSCPKCGEGVVL